MRIGIVGNYGHRNLGDEALLLGAIESARSGAGLRESEIVVLSDNHDDTAGRLQDVGCEVRQLRRAFGGRRRNLPLIVRDVYKALDGLDCVVFGGGGLINDSNPTAIPMFALVALCARLRGMPTAWWSVGIGPLSPGVRWRLGRWLLRSSRFVTVRDGASATLARRLTGGDPAIAPDLAHGLVRRLARPESDSTTVAVSVIPYRKPGLWFEVAAVEYQAYCDKIADVIRKLLRERSDVDIKLFPVSLDQDKAAIDDVRSRLSGVPRVSAISPASVDELVAALGTADLVIGTRLHSVVLATLAGVPVVTIAYQPKVRSYAEELGLGLPCFSIDTFETDEVVSESLGILAKVGTYPEQIVRINEARYDKLMKAMKEWRAIL